MNSWLKENWFKALVIILLLMIYSRLGEIKENTFYTADMVDASASRIIDSVNNLEGYLDEINNNTR